MTKSKINSTLYNKYFNKCRYSTPFSKKLTDDEYISLYNDALIYLSDKNKISDEVTYTYINRYIHSRCMDKYKSKRNQFQTQIALKDVFEDVNSYNIDDNIDDDIINLNFNRLLKQYLTEFNYNVLISHFYKNMSLVTISEEYNTSQQSIKYKINSSVDKIRKIINNNEDYKELFEINC